MPKPKTSELGGHRSGRLTGSDGRGGLGGHRSGSGLPQYATGWLVGGCSGCSSGFGGDAIPAKIYIYAAY